MGTPAYMSPEQAQGFNDQLRSSTDIYSLWAILYKLLTNQQPANGSVEQMLAQVIAAKIVPAREIDPSIPAPLEAICLKAMAKAPEDRYRRALDLAADVEAWLADEPVSVYPDSWRDRLRRLQRRHPKWVASIAVAVVMGFLAIIGATLYQVKLREDLKQTNIRLEVTGKDLAGKNLELEKPTRTNEKPHDLPTRVLSGRSLHERLRNKARKPREGSFIQRI